MKVMFDTNIYISFIRNRSHEAILQRRGTIKYISAIVLMELWAGVRNKKAERLLNQLQKPYKSANRIIILDVEDYIKAGKVLSRLPEEYNELRKKAGFINDLHMALTVQKIGATLYTENINHFKIIQSISPQFKVDYISPLTSMNFSH